MKTAVAYVRVSTNRQELGPQAQRRSILAWAASTGVEIVAWCEDRGVSGATPLKQRPGLSEAVAKASEGKALLVAAKRDRLARDPDVIADIRKVLGASQIVTTDDPTEDSPTGRFLAHILDGVAALEREMICGRIKDALAVKKAQGLHVGRPPYGYKTVGKGHLEPIPEEQTIIAKITTLASEGVTRRAMVSQLASEGVTNRRGKAFGLTQLHSIIRAQAA